MMQIANDIWAWLSGWDVRIFQALIAGLVVAFGWVVNGRQNRKAAQNLRDERLRDLHRALYAEIVVNVVNLGSVEELEATKQAQVARMLKSAAYKPFLPLQRRDMVFRNFVSEIHILPRTSIDPVVAYYSLVGTIANMEEDIRSERFSKLAKSVRASFYSDYMDLLNQSITLGVFSLQVIDVYGKEGKDAARELVEGNRFSTRLDVGQDAP